MYETFYDFFNFLNSFHPTIKFDLPQHHVEENSCEFLDLKISIKNRKIHTDLYRKETSKPNALLPSSAHPGHIISGEIHTEMPQGGQNVAGGPQPAAQPPTSQEILQDIPIR